jgi:biopolymer transport protein TolR
MITGINVTPLVDIMLVLLIVFMVTATYVTHASIEVNLPRAATGAPSAGVLRSVTLRPPAGGIDAQGGAAANADCISLALDGTEVDEATLVQRLAAAVKADADVGVMVSADTDCRHGAFVHLVDRIKEAGVVNFAINVEALPHATPAP